MMIRSDQDVPVVVSYEEGNSPAGYLKNNLNHLKAIFLDKIQLLISPTSKLSNKLEDLRPAEAPWKPR